SKAHLPKDVIEEYILAIPSIDTIASMSFRLTTMKCMYEGFDVELWNKAISEITKVLEEPLNSILRDKPPIRWLINKNVLLFFIGGEWFIEEEIRRIAKERNKDIGSALDSLRDLLKNVKKSAREYAEVSNFTVVENPGKYLAIVRADGDNMGMLTSLGGMKYLKKIGDLFLPEFNKCKKETESYKELINYTYFATPSYYSMISRTISAIAKKVADISNKYYSMIVYSGGDDLLSLCPPENCLQFSNEVRKTFSRNYLEIDDHDTKIIIPGLTKAATQSFAIHLMHIFTPISKHLEESIVELDKFAKGDVTKDSFIISYNPREGGKMIAKLPWSISNISEYILNLLSITLEFPKVIKFNRDYTKVYNSPIKISISTYRDLLQTYDLNEKRLSNEVIKSIFEYEVNRHKEFGKFEELSTLIQIDNIYCISVKLKGETSNIIIEMAKAAIALRNGLDSNPITFGENI
ncbi:MAG: type III-B CRISPR-associated protein Cas10/Cmr2, partial [Thermoprotei archaeon]